MCHREEASLSVALFNCFADPIYEPTVILDKAYSRIECVNCEAALDGNRVIIKSKLYGFTAAILRVYE